MKEVWKDISGFEGFYQVNNFGSIKGLQRIVRTGKKGTTFRTIKERMITIRRYPNGYEYVKLLLPKQENPKLVHRLMANAFIQNPENKPDINHKNGVKWDNRLENIEWCTKSENVNHAIDNGFIKTGNESPKHLCVGDKHPNSKKVKCDTLDMIFHNTRIAAEATGVDRLTVGLICNGKKTQRYGLTFRFI